MGTRRTSNGDEISYVEPQDPLSSREELAMYIAVGSRMSKTDKRNANIARSLNIFDAIIHLFGGRR